MTVIETKGIIDGEGTLKTNHPMKIKDKKVKIIVMIEGDLDKEEEKIMTSSVPKAKKTPIADPEEAQFLGLSPVDVDDDDDDDDELDLEKDDDDDDDLNF